MTPAAKHSRIITMKPSSTLHHIPAGEDFAAALVRGFMARITSAEDMADSLLLLPNRRLAKSVRLAFLRHSDGQALVLPRMLPIGDVEEDAIELAAAGWDSGDLPPVIGGLERQLHLARQLASADLPMADTMALARSLADFLDSAQANQCDFGKLADLADGDHAVHWQKILNLLDLMGQWWPMKLEELGKSDPVIWRDAAIAARAKAWTATPPRGLVVIAGSTGSVAATRQLMEAVLGLERGHVVLPGVDLGMDEEDWQGLAKADATSICHPQFQLMQLLTYLDEDRAALEHWCRPTDDAAERPRASLLREAMRPAGQTGRWQTIPDRDAVTRKGLAGLRRIDCHDQREEAEVIALAMREALETPDRTAALVTADRQLAETVAATLSRWGIDVTDSAGTRLVDTSPAQFIRLVADAWLNDLRPVSLLGLLQHRLAAAGMARAEFRRLVRRMDRHLLRGGNRYQRLDDLLRLARQEREVDIAAMLENHLIPMLAPLEEFRRDHRASLADLADLLGRVAENLAATPEEPLAIWQGQEGTRVARFLEQLAAHGKMIALTAAEWPAVLTVLLSGEVIYPDRGDHPRLAILGLVEARMQHADLIILGGMNEGTAPPQTPPDPWMSNAMRQEFGLPPAHWRVGLAAHDAWMAMSAPDVLITRAERQEGAPTEISRWLRRIEAVLKVAHIDWPQETHLRQLARQMNRSGDTIQPVPEPAPRLAAADRPRQFSATGLDTLRRDPYAVYARRVLGLSALDPLEEPPSAADRGTAIHNALRDFIKEFPAGALPEDALDRLHAHGRKAFAPFDDDPWVAAFWWPQFEAVADWFINLENSRRDGITFSHAEIEGEMTVPGVMADFTLMARADRIDLLAEGSLRVIDYKTGNPPSRTAVTEARALQLRVEAVLAAAGAFSDVAAGHEINSLEYWKLSGKRSAPGEIKSASPDTKKGPAADDMSPIADLLCHFDDDAAEWRSEVDEKDQLNKFSDYRHLARIDEWRVLAGDEEE